MGDNAIKLSAPLVNVLTTLNEDELNYASWRQSLPLLYRVTLSLNQTTASAMSGTLQYYHNLGFFPMVLGYIYSSEMTYRYPLPLYLMSTAGKHCSGHQFQEETFDLKIYEDRIEIPYTVACRTPAAPPPFDAQTLLSGSINYLIDLDFYLVELGS